MVIEAGRLVEFDHPAVLLKKPESIFYDLVKETGMFDALLEQACASFVDQWIKKVLWFFHKLITFQVNPVNYYDGQIWLQGAWMCLLLCN